MPYLRRCMHDLRNALIAFALALVVSMPLLVAGTGSAWPFTAAFVLVFALPQILLGTMVTGIFQDHAAKWLVYLVVMLCNVRVFFWDAFTSGPGFIAVLVPQLLVAFPVFYILVAWRQIVPRSH